MLRVRSKGKPISAHLPNHITGCSTIYKIFNEFGGSISNPQGFEIVLLQGFASILTFLLITLLCITDPELLQECQMGPHQLHLLLAFLSHKGKRKHQRNKTQPMCSKIEDNAK